jgi:hypothetical protein
MQLHGQGARESSGDFQVADSGLSAKELSFASSGQPDVFSFQGIRFRIAISLYIYVKAIAQSAGQAARYPDHWRFSF